VKIAILGSGSWGSALSVHFGNKGFEVVQWCREKEVVDSISKNRENRLFLRGIGYPESVKATTSVEEAVSEAEVVFSVIPVQFTPAFWNKYRGVLYSKLVVCASKGIDVEALKTLSQRYEEIFGSLDNYYVLSGPTFAREIAAGLPAAAVVANVDSERAINTIRELNTSTFRLYASSDVLGVELGGALKNVVAIATGISDGMGLGNNARAALITRGLNEIKRLGKALGAREETFYGLSGVGDLVLTCTGDLSRNRQFGLAVAEGREFTGKQVVEGVYTVKAVVELARKLSLEMPISEAVYKIIYERKNPKEIMEELLSRPVKEEKG